MTFYRTTRERVIAGLRAAELRGRPEGRPLVLTQEKIEAAQELITNGRTVRLNTKAWRTRLAQRPNFGRSRFGPCTFLLCGFEWLDYF